MKKTYEAPRMTVARFDVAEQLMKCECPWPSWVDLKCYSGGGCDFWDECSTQF